MKRYSTLTGFAIIPLIIVAAVFLIVGGGGVVVYQSQKQERIENEALKQEIESLRQTVGVQQDEESTEITSPTSTPVGNTITPTTNQVQSQTSSAAKNPVPKTDPAPVKSTETVRNKVQYKTTSLKNNGTYYCFEDRVNELPPLEAKAQNAIRDYAQCWADQKEDYQICSNNCYDTTAANSSDRDQCVNKCGEATDATCKRSGDAITKYNKQVSDLLKEICP